MEADECPCESCQERRELVQLEYMQFAGEKKLHIANYFVIDAKE